MKYISERSDLLFTELGYEKFRSHINKERAGFTKDLRTHFYGKDTPRDVILKSWGNILENSDMISKPLLEFEHDLLKKVGPYSIVKPLKERLQDIESYFQSIQCDEINPLAIELSLKRLSRLSGLRVRSQSKTIEEMKLSTSSGAPFMVKRNQCVSETIPVAITKDGISLSGREYLMTAVLGHRAQEGGISVDDVKNRIIWMFMFGVNILELILYQVLISGVKHHNLVPAYVSNDAVDVRVTKLFDTKSQKDLIISTDFDKFDQHFNRKLQLAAREMIYRLFQKESAHDWLKHVFDIKYNIPIAYDYIGDKVLLMYGHHGMASGSGGTNMDETLAHMCLQNESALENDEVLNPNSMCLGDDGILSYPGITVKKVVDSYSKHGLIMNTGKQHFSTSNAIYLRRFYDINYRHRGVCHGVYSTYRAIGRLMATERSIPWTKELIALRQLSIIENCKWHPLRERFAQWCMKGDRYRLGLDIPNFFNTLSEKVKEVTHYMPDFLGYTQNLNYSNRADYGINDWWIVKYLRSIS